MMSKGDDDNSRPLLTADELIGVCQLIYLKTGMTFGEQKRYYIERRVLANMQKLGLESAAAYLNIAAANPQVLEALINAFTINETYFYREAEHLATLSRAILPQVVANRRPGDLVRIWSIPCSSGEEPYSIAIWLLENWSMVDAWNIEIVGSDIDTDAISRARLGQYGERALARLPPDVRERYFEPEKGYNRAIVQDLRESVRFSQVNLVDQLSMATEGVCDIVFCRNVLIYFDEVARQKAASNLFDRLAPGGFLCLGHTESMSGIDSRFELTRLDGEIVYRRR